MLITFVICRIENTHVCVFIIKVPFFVSCCFFSSLSEKEIQILFWLKSDNSLRRPRFLLYIYIKKKGGSLLWHQHMNGLYRPAMDGNTLHCIIQQNAESILFFTLHFLPVVFCLHEGVKGRPTASIFCNQVKASKRYLSKQCIKSRGLVNILL